MVSSRRAYQSVFWILSSMAVLNLPLAKASAITKQTVDKHVIDEAFCAEQLDATVTIANSEPEPWSNGTLSLLTEAFSRLEKHCSNLPQVAHNLGVLAAKGNQWPEADRYFKRSLEIDTRASMTFQHLQSMHAHRAALAYAKALNNQRVLPTPRFELQNSTIQNPYFSRGDRDLHNIHTLEYEMFAWWQTLQNKTDLVDHYIEGFAAEHLNQLNDRFRHQKWLDTHREIAFTEQDAVVILSDSFQNRTLFLLKLVGNRWKIYQQTHL